MVALHYLLGMPMPMVASSLGIPLGTAKSRLHHAIAAMRPVVAEPDAVPVSRTRRAGRMTTDVRADARLTGLLEELYLGAAPAYRDEVLANAVQQRQRPAWSFPGRWLPMADIASRPAFVSSVPWRTVGLALLLIALLAATIAVVGSSRPSVPAPFGLAAQRRHRLGARRRHLHGRPRQ